MKRVFIVLSILASIAVAGPAWSFDVWKSVGGGELVVEEHALPPFNRLAIEGFANVVLIAGSTESVSIEAAVEQGVRVRIDVTDGKLTIATPQVRHGWLDFLGGSAKPVRMTLTYRTLDSLSVEGAVKLRADRLATDRLAVSASGAASVQVSGLEAKELTVNGFGAITMDVAGRTIAQRIRISGAGDYQAAKLASEAATVAVSGAGRVVVRAEKTLAIGVSGAGSVEYSGNPSVTQEISGVGRVRRRPLD